MSFLARLQITQLQRILDHKLQKSSSTPIILYSRTFNSLSSEEKCQLIYLEVHLLPGPLEIFLSVFYSSLKSMASFFPVRYRSRTFYACSLTFTAAFSVYHYVSLIKDSLESSQTPNKAPISRQCFLVSEFTYTGGSFQQL